MGKSKNEKTALKTLVFGTDKNQKKRLTKLGTEKDTTRNYLLNSVIAPFRGVGQKPPNCSAKFRQPIF